MPAELLACDLHPDYYATRFARQMPGGVGQCLYLLFTFSIIMPIS